jgi:hypothetical protein
MTAQIPFETTRLITGAVALIASVSCSSGGMSARDAGPDDAGGQIGESDAAADVGSADVGSAEVRADAPVCQLSYPSCDGGACPNIAWCEVQAMLLPGAPLTGQDTAAGGWGDCAASASGVGGPSLYYAASIPPGKYARVTAMPPTTDDNRTLLRLLPTCESRATEVSSRGVYGSHHAAVLCLPNETSQERNIVLAVSKYSGEVGGDTHVFDISLAYDDSLPTCTQAAFDLP